jgi:hypothetical protein
LTGAIAAQNSKTEEMKNKLMQSIDVSNLITSIVINPSSTTTYTATEDCFVQVYAAASVQSNGNGLIVYLDGVIIVEYIVYSGGTGALLFSPFFIRKGQTLTFKNTNTSFQSSAKIFGLRN